MNLELNDIQAEVLTRENPTALDAGALIDAEVFNHRHGPGGYFGDFYEDRIKTMHPSSRFGVFPVPPLGADNYLFLRRIGGGLLLAHHQAEAPAKPRCSVKAATALENAPALAALPDRHPFSH